MKDWLYVTLFHMFRFLIRITPERMMDVFAKVVAALLYRLDKKHRKIAQVNLNLAYGDTLNSEEKERIVRGCYLSLVRTMIDFVKNQGISREALLEKVHIENAHIMEKAREAGKKIILITAHYSNWELVALSIAAKYGEMTIIGRDLDSSVMQEILKKNREQFDISLVSKSGAMKPMIAALKEGKMLGLLVDQNTAEKEGLLVNFFGKPARHTPSAAILGRCFNAAVIPVFITLNEDSTYTLTFYDPIETQHSENKDRDIFESVQKQAAITEKVIRQKPEEWFWLHQRWKNQFEEYYK